MDFRDTAEEEEFRAGLRAWLADSIPERWGTPANHEPEDPVPFLKDWSRRLHRAGYVGVNWPERYGGRDQPITFQAIVLEEIARAEAPEHIGVIGLGMAGPTIMAHGTDEQRERFLKKILTGEEVWCQGFSEPGAGSDLAAIQTKAEPDGEGGFVVTGQKVWSSFAHIADWCLLLARTDSSGDVHQGLTYLLMDMHAPGVEVRPIRQITGDAEFNEIFMEGVRVPADRVLGRPGQGWAVAITTLMNERANVGFVLTVRLEVAFNRLVRLARSTKWEGGRVAAEDPFVRRRLAELWADVQAMRFTIYRAFSSFLATGMPGPEGSVAKLFWSDTAQRLARTGLELEGVYAQLAPGSEYAVDDGWWQHAALRSRGNSIEAGTSEILRNIVAERVLGLPRSR